MFDILNIILAVGITLLICVIYIFKNIVKKARSMTKYQTYSKSVDSSMLETGLYTEHGIVFDAKNKTLIAQHKRSEFFYG